jgi:magnesium-transporting ATPase (P-type)
MTLLAVIGIVALILHPLIPTSFAATAAVASRRLASRRISCWSTESLFMAAKVDMAFFDKTGTLTQQGMDFHSAQFDQGKKKRNDKICEIGMALCHSLTTTNDGKLVGTHIDLASFKSTGASLVRASGEHPQIHFRNDTFTILKVFEFDHVRKTQSVIVQDMLGAKFAFVKGSPAAIKDASAPFTVPSDFDESVQKASICALYQLAIAFKILDPGSTISGVRRNEIEENLIFGGFLNFKNNLRNEACEVLQQLREAQIKTSMITGDDVLTGVSIARAVGMIAPENTVLVGNIVSNEVAWVNADTGAIVGTSDIVAGAIFKDHINLAISGEAWQMLRETDSIHAFSIGKHVSVFGRCSPSDKVSVVASFTERGHVTLMCGDGQNDCSSLKTASVGIALSNAEASLAAPFTSHEKSLLAVPEVIREGRCALASAIAAYSSLILYGQACTLLITLGVYFGHSAATNAWIMLEFVAVPLALSLTLSKAASKLTPRSPTSSLLSQDTVISIAGTLWWNFVFLVVGLATLWNQEWFSCRYFPSRQDRWNNVDKYDTQVAFLLVLFQVVANSMILNFGYSFRRSWSKNYVLVFCSLVWCLSILLFILLPSKFSCFFRFNCTNEV